MNDHMKDLARAAADVDTADIPALVRLHDDLAKIAATFDAPPTVPVAVACRRAADDVETLILRRADDGNATLAEVRQAIEHARKLLGAPATGARVGAASKQASTPDADQPGSGPDDPVEFQPEAYLGEFVAEFVCESREHLAEAERSLLALESEPANTELINTAFRAFHTIKGVAGFMHLDPIVRLAHNAESLLDHARSDPRGLNPDHIDTFLQSCDVLGQLVGMLDGGTPPARRGLDQLIDRLTRASESAQTPASLERTRAQDKAPPSTTNTSSEARAEQMVKVSTERMDALINTVGELVIGHEMMCQDQALAGINSGSTSGSLGQVSRTINELQEVSMSLRLVSLKATFQKMTRLVRDISARAGKEVRLHTEGDDVELDRNVVEEIADPLVHLLRNACDHGIEPSEERLAAGKPPEGNIRLRAYHQGGAVVIEIADDGRGLNRERILHKAVERDLCQPRPGHADPTIGGPSDHDVFSLIFAPGFSTAEDITDVSGRGVGMDVVRRNIHALRGRIEISSTPGEGSTFTLRLPLTLAVIDGMIVRVGTERYIIPTLRIDHCVRPAPGEIRTIVGRGEVVDVRGHLLPVFRASRALGLDGESDSTNGGILVVLETGTTQFCLFVDELVGRQQVVIKSLGRAVAPIPGVSGGAILGDGRVALIIDVDRVVHTPTAVAA